MFHLLAFEQSIDPGGALTPINAIREEQFAVNGVDFRVPAAFPFLVAAAALANDASVTRAQVQSPSLRVLANHDVEPIIAALLFGSPPEAIYHPEAVTPLTPDEALNFAFLSDPAAAVIHRGLVWISDGPLQMVQGNIFTLRATSVAALVTGTWVNATLTFGQVLPAGRYQVVGLRSRGTNLVAARLVFPEQVARPGVAAVNGIADIDPYWPRFGRMGVYGEFDHTVPPTVDCLGTVDAAQVHLIDLLRIG
jgi:hypothetical protein